jgi:hypothetical protein
VTGNDKDDEPIRSIEPPVGTQDTTAPAPAREHDTVSH